MTKLPPNILKTASKGKHSEDGGLQLRITSVKENGSRQGSWYFRYSFQGKQQEVGLGSIKRLTLAQARAERDRYADIMADKRNPRNPKDAKAEERALNNAPQTPSLAEVTQQAFEAKKGELKADGAAGRWMSPLNHHVLPKLGSRPVDEVSRDTIRKTLEPIWRTKPATAQKAINRLGIVMRYARAMGLPIDPMAVEDAKQLLGAQGHKPNKHPALPAEDARKFFQALDTQNVTQRALAFYLLAGGGARVKPTLSVSFDQIHGDVWIIPGEDMKGRRDKVDDFRVPLTRRMQDLIELSRQQNETGDLAFRSPKQTKQGEASVTDQSVENVMRKFERDWNWDQPYRLHGLRATFRTWAGKANPAIYAVAETALGHSVGKLVERSYERNDFLEERRNLLEAWAAFLESA